MSSLGFSGGVMAAWSRVERAAWTGGCVLLLASVAFWLYQMSLLPIEASLGASDLTAPARSVVTAAADPTSSGPEGLDLRGALPEATLMPTAIARLYDAADLQQLAVTTVQYEHGMATAEGAAFVDVDMTLSAGYPAVRKFINQVLLTQDAVALTALRGSKESAQAAELTWQLRLRVFYQEVPR